jgi:peptidoglycan hydrolase FlgJ
MTAPVSFYADFQSLASLRHEAKTQDPAALKEAAKQFESLFTQMLLKSMREANRSFGDSMLGGEQGEFYQDMFDDQMAVHLSQGKGLGLADMLMRQLASEGSGLGTRGSGQSVEAMDEAPALLRPTPHAPRPAPSKADFVRTYMPHAEKAARALGVDPHALLAQAALETGWGKSVPCNANGDCSFNLFGVKATGWSGASVTVPTLEFEEGIPVRKVERFRTYDSPADSFVDYARLIAGSSRYENALGAGGDVAAFASALQQGGYATDPQYATKVVRVADEVRAVAAELKLAGAAPMYSDGGV